MLNYSINFKKFTNAQMREWGRALCSKHNKITKQNLTPPPAEEYHSPFEGKLDPDLIKSKKDINTGENK